MYQRTTWIWRLIESELYCQTNSREEKLILEAYDLVIQGFSVKNAVKQVSARNKSSDQMA